MRSICPQRGPFALLFALVALAAARAGAQDAPAPPAPPEMPPHDHAHMMEMDGWQLTTDGELFAAVNHQGGSRGGDEFFAPNWLMATASRNTSRGRVTFNAMLSLDPATVGRAGYREIFQVGESLDGRPLVDRQHPHDFFMQLAASWRLPLGSSTGLTLSGGPAAEPALGPPAFMHRPSAGDNPAAPLSHHTFDSTHISFGVVTVGVDRGPWAVEASVFNGREPDDRRWNFDFARLDSVSGRVWFRPTPSWSVQVSTGRLTDPEALEPGDVQRTTASVSWSRTQGEDVDAITIGYGRNDTDAAARQAGFLEGSRRVGRNALYGRLELVQVETPLLVSLTIPSDEAAGAKDPVLALTIGGVRRLARIGRFEGGLGADFTLYRVPAALEPSYGSHPVSFKVFFILRGGSGSMGAMSH
jgi:hypothetical protein